MRSRSRKHQSNDSGSLTRERERTDASASSTRFACPRNSRESAAAQQDSGSRRTARADQEPRGTEPNSSEDSEHMETSNDETKHGRQRERDHIEVALAIAARATNGPRTRADREKKSKPARQFPTETDEPANIRHPDKMSGIQPGARTPTRASERSPDATACGSRGTWLLLPRKPREP